MQKLDLPVEWQLRAVGRTEQVPAEILNKNIPAVVPGCVHLDLMRAGLIPDPYLDLNEALVQWIGFTDWEYSTRWDVAGVTIAEERVDLVCEGLDCIATIWINDIEVGQSENMHVERRFEIKEHLREGENTMRIRFDSAVYWARENMAKLGELPHASVSGAEPFHFIRKNACNFGWDWGPTLTTAGVWKPIRLEAWSVARIKSVKPLVKVANEKVAVVDVLVELERTYGKDEGAVTAEVSLNGDAKEAIDISDEDGLLLVIERQPNIWWPVGYGEQPLYNLSVRIVGDLVPNGLGLEGDIDVWEHKIGLREVELDTSPDEIGAAWTLKVNGKEIWCKGANWIPDDVFLPRACGYMDSRLEEGGSPADSQSARGAGLPPSSNWVRERLEQARDANMNMMRVWGGGIYETDEFYDICDEMGILVWQDFLFACAAYSEDAATSKSIEEARFNVARLARHPSLVLWNGCNENIWGFFDWGWEKKLDGKAWGAGYYFDLLPRVVAEVDPSRPYWPGSPYSGSMQIHPLADAYGNKHMWDTWNDANFTHFRRYSPRFASEFGHQAPPNFSTLARAIPASAREPYSVSMLSHQKAPGGNEKMEARLMEHFALPTDFDDWLYLTQLIQARAMTVACEWFRTRSQCRGALYWQLNDCWPVSSWAAIDGDGKPKPLYYATKRFFRERLLSIQPDGEGLALWAHNDSDEEWHCRCAVDVWWMQEAEEAAKGMGIKEGLELSFVVEPRALKRVTGLSDLKIEDPTREFLATHGMPECETEWFFESDKNLNYPEPKWTTEIVGSYLRVTAQTLLRDLTINADRFGGTVTYVNGVTLLPGETWEVEILGADLSGVDFSGRPIVQCANWYGKQGE